MPIHNPKNDKPLDRLHAFLSVDASGNEGIIAAPFPLITGDPKLIPALREIAEIAILHAPDKKIVQAEFIRKI